MRSRTRAPGRLVVRAIALAALVVLVVSGCELSSSWRSGTWKGVSYRYKSTIDVVAPWADAGTYVETTSGSNIPANRVELMTNHLRNGDLVASTGPWSPSYIAPFHHMETSYGVSPGRWSSHGGVWFLSADGIWYYRWAATSPESKH